MIRSSAVRLAAVAAAAALTLALAGCAAGLNAQTNQPFNTTDGASTVFHGIAIRNVFVLGPSVGATLRPGQSAGLFLALVNDGAPDRLVGIEAPGTASSVTIRGGSVNLPAGQAALLTGPEPQVVLEALQRPLTGGIAVSMTLFFQSAGSITINVPVVARSQYYTTLSPPQSPTPTLTGKPGSAHPSRSSRPSATPAASQTP